MEKLSYILQLRKALKQNKCHMPLFQNGSAIILRDDQGNILLQERMDRDMWGLPGGLQELGETFEEVAVRELSEETGLVINQNDLTLVSVVSGKSRYNTYPNGDEVYNNTVLYLADYADTEGTLTPHYEEIINNKNDQLVLQRESKQLKFFALDQLPKNLMDRDLIETYRNYLK